FRLRVPALNFSLGVPAMAFRRFPTWAAACLFVLASSLVSADTPPPGDSPSVSEIVSAELVLDGSSEPPGDLVRAVVLLDAQTRDAHLEVEAYVVTGERNEKQTRVLGKTQKNADGHFVARVPLVTQGSVTKALSPPIFVFPAEMKSVKALPA